VSWDSSISRATGYGLDIFSTSPDQPWDPPNLLYNEHKVSFPGVTRLGHGINHTPPSNAEVKEIVALYLYSPSGLHGLFRGELYLLPDRLVMNKCCTGSMCCKGCCLMCRKGVNISLSIVMYNKHVPLDTHPAMGQ
jgi:hypothetical protein